MNITSVSSATAKAYLELEGLVNASKIVVIGLSIVVFPEFAGPQITIFLSFALPFVSKSRNAAANT